MKNKKREREVNTGKLQKLTAEKGSQKIKDRFPVMTECYNT